MWFFDFLFGKKKERRKTQTHAESDSGQDQAPGTMLAYRPDLIPQLTADHQRLLTIFGWISAALTSNDLASVGKHLDTFRKEILAHLMSENLYLYVYLEHVSRHKSHERFKLVHRFRREMDTIGKVVLAFLAKYQDIGTQPHLASSLGKDLEAIGPTLVERIKLEEEALYPLYLPT